MICKQCGHDKFFVLEGDLIPPGAWVWCQACATIYESETDDNTDLQP